MNINLVRHIEELAANAWPAQTVQHLGGWRLRFSGGSSRRVNSVWPNRPRADVPLDAALVIVEDFYQRHNTVPRFQICPAALPGDLPEILAARGYYADAHTQVQTATVETVLAHTSQPDCQTISANTLTEDWFHAYVTASGYSPESLPIRRGILSRIGPKRNFLQLSENGTPVAVGLGVVERGWMGVFCVVTVLQARRRGFASSLMHALTNWGAAQGAENIYLQVMEDNGPALRLYEQMGFLHLYQYSYFQQMAASQP
jgi:GNAT superfamily N-acetyltransferase